MENKLFTQYDLFLYRLHKIPENICIWIAWRLPKEIVKWAAVRLIAHAASGEYKDEEVPNLRAMDALEAWDK